MTFRITTDATGNGTVIQIAGRLSRDGLAEVRRSIAAADQPVSMDLGPLQHADAEALSLLAALESAGIELNGLSQYMQLMLARHRYRE
ncbi:MAG: hypothetical protein K9L70_05205 [Thiohalocapsa sp.]|nr:hypothetical protein [Thiohalocapsa sp.]